jgi:predicted nucleic acid-binding protein
MATFIADTNVWLRYVDPASPHHPAAVTALEEITTNATLILVPQNLFEFWVVSTRPKDSNGLGWTPAEAAERLEELRCRFQFKPDPSDLTEEWLKLVQEHNVQGKRAHDARIAAALLANAADYLVSFNKPDFCNWPIVTIHPTDINALFRIS